MNHMISSIHCKVIRATYSPQFRLVALDFMWNAEVLYVAATAFLKMRFHMLLIEVIPHH